MTIEFKCTSCGQTLRVSDDAAGKRAKCPKCSQIVDIPDRPAPLEPTPSPPSDIWDDLGESPFGREAVNPYTAPRQTPYPASPFAAGSPFAGGKIGNVPVDVGSIMNYAWEVWKENLGMLVGATVVLVGISWALAYASSIFAAIIARGIEPEVGMAFNILAGIIRWLIDVFLGVGYCQMTLKMARRQRVDFGELFAGGPRYLPTLGVSILFGLAVAGGCLLCIVPGIIVALMWWPCYYLVVDNKSNVMDSFGVARTITVDNFGTTFLLWLVGAGISLIGLAACCVGILAAGPLVAVMWTTGYLMMSGQLPLQPLAAQGKPYA